MEQIALALGSNEGDRMAAMRGAVAALAPFVDVTAVSHVYETEPVYIDNQPLFLNAALIGTTKLAPLALLWNVKRAETQLGRTPTYRYGPRVIDIDVIFYGDQSFVTPELTIPHPSFSEREFVLRPLADVAAGWTDPRSGRKVAELLAALPGGGATDHGPLG